MNKFILPTAIICIIILMSTLLQMSKNQSSTQDNTLNILDTITLPDPDHSSSLSIETVLQERRSIRDYHDRPLTLSEVSQLLWAAQGVTRPDGYRTAPSAGALYPLEVYILTGEVNDLPAGTYKYKPHAHELELITKGDVRLELCDAALDQSCIKEGAAVIVFCAVYERTTQKYGERGIRYVHMEVGHAAQNIYLQAVSLNLGTVVIGAFHDDEVKQIVNMTDEEQPLYIMPVGGIR
jgi:SagB-type dehydrogenase family enzyme